MITIIKYTLHYNFKISKSSKDSRSKEFNQNYYFQFFQQFFS